MNRTALFRYVVMRGGADFGILTPAADSVPTIRMQASGEIKTSFSGDFLPTVYALDGHSVLQGESVNWLNDELRPEMVLDGITYTLGVFLPATVQQNETMTGTHLHVEAYDRCWRIKDNYTTASQYFASGVKYMTAIEQLLAQAGISLIRMTPTDATLAEAREDWNIGTSNLTIVNQLLSEINYNPLWFNQDGLAILEPASVPSAANIKHNLDASDPATRILPGLTRQTDIYLAPNVFTCVCSNADKSGPMVATAENTNPQSALSIPRRGRRIQTVVNVNNIASQEELQAYADTLRNKSMITSEIITVQTGLLPGFGVNDVTAISYGDDLSAICVERGWTMTLQAGGTMTHTLEKVVVNLG